MRKLLFIAMAMLILAGCAPSLWEVQNGVYDCGGTLVNPELDHVKVMNGYYRAKYHAAWAKEKTIKLWQWGPRPAGEQPTLFVNGNAVPARCELLLKTFGRSRITYCPFGEATCGPTIP